jgi:hypothetical protein
MHRVKSLWDEVREVAARGGSPVVTFPAACEVIIPPGSPGRPRCHPEGSKRGHGYALTTSSGRPLRCRRRGCQRTLPINATTIVCSTVCADLLRRECSAVLDVLDGRVEARYFAGQRRWNDPWLNEACPVR